jgi:hypothetical protein
VINPAFLEALMAAPHGTQYGRNGGQRAAFIPVGHDTRKNRCYELVRLPVV